jgi:ubiquinol-cytochrome c reductase cytochrome b subunit
VSASRDPLARPVEFVDERLGAGKLMRKTLRYVFPEHWSFMLGELVLYSFVVLVLTGIFLALLFEPSLERVRYDGSYAPLAGTEVSKAYASALDISFDVPFGLVVRQTHHWAALVFFAAIVLHLMRVFFTGAFRKPRELNWIVGLTLLSLGMIEGFLGYSLLDDLLSGMGLAIAYSVAMSIPVVGGDFAHLLWGGEFPGADVIQPRLFASHVFLIPAIMGGLLVAHLAMIMIQKHTQFPGRGRREDNVVGVPMWPGYALRSLSLFFATAAVLVLLGGLAQINPIWLWGPYEIQLGSNGAEPDWFLGWLIGALRLMPPFDVVVGEATLIPNPFFGGVLLPTAIFGVLYLWPWLEQRFITRDFQRHELLDRPRDNPTRTAFGAALFTFVATVFASGAADRFFLAFGIPYVTQVWVFRISVFVLPVVAFVVTRRTCLALRVRDEHPLRSWRGRVARRAPEGGFVSSEDP